MKRSVSVALAGAAAALLAASLMGAAPSGATEAKAPASKAERKAPGGKELFTTYKCMNCHSIETEKIERKKTANAAESAEDKPDATAAGSARKNPDLSGVGAKMDAAWMAKYLMKQEKLEEKLHKTAKFRGTPEELKILCAWLETLKTPAKSAAASTK